MPFSKRQFLKAATIHAASLYSTSAFSCGAGPDREKPVLAPLPAFDFLSDSFEDGIEKFLDKEYGRGYWVYSVDPITFRTPELAESHNSIPIEIRACDLKETKRYQSIALFVQRFVHVSKSGESCKPYCPRNRSAITRVAEFKLGEEVLPDISMRIRISNYDSSAVKMIAAFTDARTKRVEVVKQNGSIRLSGCFFEIDGYLDGGKPNAR